MGSRASCIAALLALSECLQGSHTVDIQSTGKSTTRPGAGRHFFSPGASAQVEPALGAANPASLIGDGYDV